MKKQLDTADEENRQLQTVLLECQEEMGHMNEKLLIGEASGDKMKTKLNELEKETDLLAKDTLDLGAKGNLEKVATKISEVIFMPSCRVGMLILFPILGNSPNSLLFITFIIS